MLRLVRRQTLSAISDMAFAFCSVPPNSDMQMGGSKLTNMPSPRWRWEALGFTHRTLGLYLEGAGFQTLRQGDLSAQDVIVQDLGCEGLGSQIMQGSSSAVYNFHGDYTGIVSDYMRLTRGITTVGTLED